MLVKVGSVGGGPWVVERGPRVMELVAGLVTLVLVNGSLCLLGPWVATGVQEAGTTDNLPTYYNLP